MTVILSSVNSGVFLLLSILHIYWTAGGKFGASAAVPQKPTGEALFAPGPVATLIVAAGLLLFSALFAIQAGLLPQVVGASMTKYASAVVGALFILRAIGDFRYAGSSKRITGNLCSAVHPLLLTTVPAARR